MKSQKKFDRYDSVLRREAIIKSLLLGAVFGAGVGFVVATVFWFLSSNGILPAVLSFVVVTLALMLVFYKTVFSPTVKKNAKRLDRYGLDERLITMVELEGDDSYIAEVQRRDAVENLGKLDKKQVKIKIATVIIVLIAVFGTLFAGAFATEALSNAGVIPSGIEVWHMIFPPEPPEEFNVKYSVGKGGYIIGNAEQTVTDGEDGERVLAVAEDGYMFLAWNDGVFNPSRKDTEVTKDIEVSAIFIEVKDDEDAGDDEDEPDDVPGEGQGPGDQNNPGGGGGKYEEVNQIIDGDTYYRDVYEHYYEDLLKALEEREDISDEMRDIIETYFGIIK